MTDTAIGKGKKPLDIKLLQNVVVDDECPQLEFVVDDEFLELPPLERKYKKLLQHELDEKIKRFKEHIGNKLELPDNQLKLRRTLWEFEQEDRLRKIEQRKLEEEQNAKDLAKAFIQVASTSRKAPETKGTASKLHLSNGVTEEPELRVVRTRAATLKRMQEVLSKRGSSENFYASSGSPHSEEIDHANYPTKGKGPSVRPVTFGEDAFYDRVRNKIRVDSGEQAGPSSRQGLRSGQLQACHGCDRKVSPTNLCSIGTGTDCAVYCPSCSQKQFPLGGSHLLPTKHRQSDNSSESSGDVFAKETSAKRRRHSANIGEPVGSVVELCSSDEDEMDTEDVNIVIKPQRADQEKGYALRSTNARRKADAKLAYPSKDDPEAVEVEYQDLQRLAPLEFLNDTIIDFYIKYMQRPEFLIPEQKRRFYFFNSFFYKKLFETAASQPSKKRGPDLSKLRKWTKGTNIFEKDYLFVPIHDKWHWSLAIVCNPGGSDPENGSERCILHLDSMSPGHKSAGIFRLLKMYLAAEWAHQSGENRNGGSCRSISSDFTTRKVQVPQQDNESDCGLFLLHYIQCFLREAPLKFKLSDLDDGNLFGRNWFKPSTASQLRKEILNLLEDLFDNRGVHDSLNEEPIENMAVLCQPSVESPNNTLQVCGHDPDYSLCSSEDMQILQRQTEHSQGAHSPDQSSTEYVSVKSSPSPEVSTYSGSQHRDGIELMGSDTDGGNSAPGHPVDLESYGKATSDLMEPSHPHVIADESLQVYVELGDVRKMDVSETKDVELLKAS